MVKIFVDVHPTGFLRRKAAELSCTSPVPPRMEQHIYYLIRRIRVEMVSVKLVGNTAQMEATFMGQKDACETLHVVISDQQNTPPSCREYYTRGNGFTCSNGLTDLVEGFGSFKPNRYVLKKIITSTWVSKHKDIKFPLPLHSDIDQ